MGAEKNWTYSELLAIYKYARHVESYANRVTGGKGLEWMLLAFRNLTITHGSNTGEHSETGPTIWGPKIWLGKEWSLNHGGWNAEQLFMHELAHAWDINALGNASAYMAADLGGWNTLPFGGLSGQPRWDPRVNPNNGDAYSNYNAEEYFAEGFSWTIYDKTQTPVGVSDWIDNEISLMCSVWC